MNKIEQFILTLVGKKVLDENNLAKVSLSKAKLTALISVIVTAVQVLGPVFGHPVNIPDWVFKLLAGVGLWALRDGMPPQQP